MQNEKCEAQLAAPTGELIRIIKDLSDNGGLQAISDRLGALLCGLRGEQPARGCEPIEKLDSVIQAAGRANERKYALLDEISDQLSEFESLLRS